MGRHTFHQYCSERVRVRTAARVHAWFLVGYAVCWQVGERGAGL